MNVEWEKGDERGWDVFYKGRVVEPNGASTWLYYVAGDGSYWQAAYWLETEGWNTTRFPRNTPLDEVKATIVAMHKLEGN